MGFKMTEYLPVAGAFVLPHVGGIIGAIVISDEVKTWYPTLKRPSWRPPNWAFAPVWTSLYTGMGAASYLVWRDGGGFNGEARLPLMLYGANLALNWMWSPIFFKAHKKGLALVEILALWGTVGACTYTFWPVNQTAAYLMLPYWAWITLASALTYSIWRDNKVEIEETKED